MASEAQKKRGFILPENLTGYPMLCVQFQCPDTPEYRAAVRGVLQQLGKYYTWERSDEKPLARDAAQIWRDLIHETLTFNDECGQPGEDSGCIELPLNHPSLEWNPNDPFRTPELVPGGYAFPPWYKANSITGITLGTSLGDIVTDITRTQSIPVIPPSSGYPRLRIHLKGEGVVQLRLVQLNAGGYVQITTDDDIFSIEIMELNKDIISIPPESSDDIIIEREIHGAGDHHVDMLFIPRVNDELLPPVTQGGAVRGIKLCGFDEMFKPCPEPEPCPDCPDCEDCEDYIEDELGYDLEELEMLLDCYKHSVGDIKMSAVPNVSGGWLLCDGSSHSKLQYPELAAALEGVTPSDETTFSTPDFSLRSPMGTGYHDDIGALPPLGTAGSLTHQLTAAEMPEHSHDLGSHTHDIEQHSHTVANHQHGLGSHTHTISPNPHAHDILTRTSVATGGNTRLARAGGDAAANSNVTSETVSLTVDAGGSGLTGLGGSGSTSSQALVTQAASGTSASAGGDQSHANVHPVIGVLFYIFAGCAVSGEDCQ